MVHIGSMQNVKETNRYTEEKSAKLFSAPPLSEPQCIYQQSVCLKTVRTDKNSVT